MNRMCWIVLAWGMLVCCCPAIAQEGEDADLAPPQTASLTVCVIAEETGEPVAEAKVLVQGGQVGMTDPDGICLLDGLPARRALVTVSKEEFATAHLYANLEPGKEASLKIALDPEGKIVGIVTSEFGEILPDSVCSVYTKEEGRTAYEKVDENGLFTLDGLSMKNTYTLYVSNADYCTKILQEVKIPEDTGLLTLEIALDMGATIKGRVTDKQGRPVQGARVAASGSRETVETDAEGMYALQRLEPEETWVRVSAPKYAPERQQVTPKRDGTTVNFRLAPGRRIAGTVVDQQDRPVAGVLVRAYASYFGTVGELKTVEDGKFEFDALPEGRIYLRTTAEGYSNPGVSANAGQDNVTITLYPVGHLLGKVVDKEGEPVTEFRVFVSPASVRSGEHRGEYPSKFPTQTGMPFISPTGEFEIAGTTTGAPYKVTIVTRDYAPETAPRIMGLPLDEKEFTTITVEKGVSFTGKVLDATTEKPIAGAELILSGQSFRSNGRSSRYRSKRGATSRLSVGSLTCSSGEEGVFELHNVAPRSYYVLVIHPDYAELSAGRISFEPSATSRPGDATYVTIPPATAKGIEGAAFRLSKGATISGHAYDKDGKPLAGARIVLAGRTYATTNEEGAFRFDKILPGNYRLTCYAIGAGGSKWDRTYRTVSLTVEADEDKVADFRPFDGVTLTGRLKGNKKLWRKLRINLSSRSDKSLSVSTVPDTKGRFTIKGLAPGRYTVTALSYKSRRWKTVATKSVTVSEKRAPQVVLEVE